VTRDPDAWSGGLHLHELADTARMNEAVAAFASQQLARSLVAEGQALLAVSGGRSPQLLLERLAREPLDWSRITVVLVDERAVGLRHPLSNTRAIRDWLLRDHASCADLRSFVPDSAEASLDIEALAQQANAIFPVGRRITVALLGLGVDGHFASIFAGMADRRSAIDPDSPSTYLPVHLREPPPEAPVDRVSLSLACLLKARHWVMPVVGEAKRAAFDRARLLADPDWPVSLLIHQQTTPLHVWLARS
jgi:6-phosphogluconolactonase